MLGLVYALLAQIGWATGLLIVNRKLGHLPPLALNFCIAAGGAVSLLPVLFFVRNDLVGLIERPQTPWLWMALAGFVWVVVADSIFVFAAQRSDPRLIALTSLFFPAFVIGFEIVLGRPVDLWFLAGFAMMATGFAVIVRRPAHST